MISFFGLNLNNVRIPFRPSTKIEETRIPNFLCTSRTFTTYFSLHRSPKHLQHLSLSMLSLSALSQCSLSLSLFLTTQHTEQ